MDAAWRGLLKYAIGRDLASFRKKGTIVAWLWSDLHEQGGIMYDGNTLRVSSRDLRFKDILANAADTILSRLRKYDEGSDPLQRNRLKLLYDIVSLEMEKVESGLADAYSGLNGPIRAVVDWGEPSDSSLMKALRDVETFHSRHYWIDDLRTLQMSH